MAGRCRALWRSAWEEVGRIRRELDYPEGDPRRTHKLSFLALGVGSCLIGLGMAMAPTVAAWAVLTTGVVVALLSTVTLAGLAAGRHRRRGP